MPQLSYVLVAGYAQLPQTTGAGVLHRHLTILVKVDRATGRVMDASTTLATRLADAFVREQLIGYHLGHDDGFESTIESHYFGNGQKAIIGAFRDLCRRYSQASQADDAAGPPWGAPSAPATMAPHH